MRRKSISGEIGALQNVVNDPVWPKVVRVFEDSLAHMISHGDPGSIYSQLAESQMSRMAGFMGQLGLGGAHDYEA